MVVSTPFGARIRFIDSEYESIQTLTRLQPELTASQIQTIMQAVNVIRNTSHPATGGFYTIMDELTLA
jgi:hypothetical protein